MTMLQRSPTYILSIPSEDPIANGLRRLLGDRRAYPVTRWKNVAISTLVYQLSQRFPRLMRGAFRRGAMRAAAARLRRRHPLQPALRPMGPAAVPGARRRPVQGDLGGAGVDGHRPDRALHAGGIRLASGAELEADIVVMATGLKLLALGGVALEVDGEPVVLPERLAYKGMMLGGVPNMAFTIGYTNASWTLKADLVAEFVCRLLERMDREGLRECVPSTTAPWSAARCWTSRPATSSARSTSSRRAAHRRRGGSA